SPPCSASDSASSSTRSAVSDTAPRTASASCLTRSSMRTSAAPLPPPLPLRLRRGLRGGCFHAVDARYREQLGRRLCGRGLLCLFEPRFDAALADGLALAACELRLSLLPDRQQRCRDENRRVGAGQDPDEQREREVLQRRAAEREQRDDRQQRDEGGRQ